MANYTIELRAIVEGGRKIFPYNYPFYDEKRRAEFERNFIRHFYFREIGVETIDKFIFYLENKLYEVLPYYNELFKTAQIEYSILDNYKLSETTTIKRENRGKTSGISSSVGRVYEDQTATTTTTQTTDTTSDSTATGNNITQDNTDSKTVLNGESTTTSTGSETSETSGSSETTKTENVVKKYLDTPQGLTDLTDTKYLTTLNQDTATGKDNTNTETGSTKNTSNSALSITNETTTGDTDRTITENTTFVTDIDGTEKSEGKTETHFTGEQKNTADNNSRSESVGTHSETLETLRVGNIGIDTDADMIQKHIKLQQILKKIELMFFDDCEDLFMGVF